MKKRLLFIAPGYYGFNDVVHKALIKYSDYKIIAVNSTQRYQYKNLYERIYNLFLKTFTNKNIKEIKKGRHIQQIIDAYPSYDLLIVNRADVLSAENLDLALLKSKKSKSIFWDSVEKIPNQKAVIGKFDQILSFDANDCNKYKFKEITNFYFIEKPRLIKEYWDVALLMTYDNRIADVIKLFNYFKANKIKAKAKIYTYKSNSIKEKLPDNIEIIHKMVPFKDAFNYYLDSKCILDLTHHNQIGISFRPYEAMGLQKKIISTNHNIKKSDFYSPENIYIIDDMEQIHIPKSFFDNSYQPLDQRLIKKYYVKNWIDTIITD